jgi:hypothetical protein
MSLGLVVLLSPCMSGWRRHTDEEHKFPTMERTLLDIHARSDLFHLGLLRRRLTKTKGDTINMHKRARIAAMHACMPTAYPRSNILDFRDLKINCNKYVRLMCSIITCWHTQVHTCIILLAIYIDYRTYHWSKIVL